jgi:hypothetical protein
MLRRILYSLLLLSLIDIAPPSGQQPPRPQANQAGLEELIASASLRVSEYRAKFKDLTADEEQQVEEMASRSTRVCR